MEDTLSLSFTLILMAAATGLICAAFYDANTYRIPNFISLALLLLFPLYVFTSPLEVEWNMNLMVFLLVLVVGFVMFARGVAGAGDIKLLAIMGLWAGPHYLGLFLFITAISGGLLAAVVAGLAYRRMQIHGPKKVLALAQAPIPYGVAIAIGGLCTLIMLSHPHFLDV